MRGHGALLFERSVVGGTTFRRGGVSHIKQHEKVPSSDAAKLSCGLRSARGNSAT
jgi:hypothetical protein